MEAEDHNSRIAKQIVARARMARGVVVLDENAFGLESALRGANLKVVTSFSSLADDQIKQQLLHHRILITTNPADFIDDAPIHEYGVVALDKLTCVDSAPEYRKNRTAQLISKAMSKYGLLARGAKFLLELRDDGKHQLTELT